MLQHNAVGNAALMRSLAMGKRIHTGPGRRTVMSLHKSVEKDFKNQVMRLARGRYVWWPALR
jgi:hypothetical protein